MYKVGDILVCVNVTDPERRVFDLEKWFTLGKEYKVVEADPTGYVVMGDDGYEKNLGRYLWFITLHEYEFKNKLDKLVNE